MVFGMAEGYDYHFLVLAPGLQSAWFFQAARLYWQRFQPIVTDDLEFISLVPEDARIGVTLLARSDTIEFTREQLDDELDALDDLRIDEVVADDLATMESILNKRANEEKPFG